MMNFRATIKEDSKKGLVVKAKHVVGEHHHITHTFLKQEMCLFASLALVVKGRSLWKEFVDGVIQVGTGDNVNASMKTTSILGCIERQFKLSH